MITCRRQKPVVPPILPRLTHPVLFCNLAFPSTLSQSSSFFFFFLFFLFYFSLLLPPLTKSRLLNMASSIPSEISSLLSLCSPLLPSTPSTITVKMSQKMGFSGATVYDFAVSGRLLFMKRICFSPDAANLDRDVKSYKAEIAFLQHGPSAVPSLTFPTLVASYVSPSGLEFVIVTESLSSTHSSQVPASTDLSSLVFTLSSLLATFHGSTSPPPPILDLWPVGGHICHTLSSLPLLSGGLAAFCSNFSSSAHPAFQLALDRDLPSRFQSYFDRPGPAQAQAPPFPHLIHGDPKLANFLFPTTSSSSSSSSSSVLLDFQWAGKGRGASDLVYLFATSAGDAMVSRTAALKSHYYSAYSAAAGEEERMTLAEFEEDWDAAVLEFARWVWSHRFPELKTQTPEMYDERRKEADFNVGNYQKSVVMIGWLVEEVERIVGKKEEEEGK